MGEFFGNLSPEGIAVGGIIIVGGLALIFVGETVFVIGVVEVGVAAPTIIGIFPGVHAMVIGGELVIVGTGFVIIGGKVIFDDSAS